MNGDGIDTDFQIARTFKIYTNIKNSYSHPKNKKAKRSPFEKLKAV